MFSHIFTYLSSISCDVNEYYMSDNFCNLLSWNYFFLSVVRKSNAIGLLFFHRMVAAQDEDDDHKYPEEMIRAFALLKASKAQFQAHPERIEFEGSSCVT